MLAREKRMAWCVDVVRGVTLAEITYKEQNEEGS